MPNIYPDMPGRPSIDDQAWKRALSELKRAIDGGLFVKDLAAGIRVSAPSVSNWLNGKSKPTAENLIAALKFIGKDPRVVIPEIVCASDEVTLADIDTTLCKFSEFLALTKDELSAAHRTDFDSAVWGELPTFMRRAAMAAVYMHNCTIEQARDAAVGIWGRMTPKQRDAATTLGEAAHWAYQIGGVVQNQRKESGTLPSPAVGRLSKASSSE